MRMMIRMIEIEMKRIRKISMMTMIMIFMTMFSLKCEILCLIKGYALVVHQQHFLIFKWPSSYVFSIISFYIFCHSYGNRNYQYV